MMDVVSLKRDSFAAPVGGLFALLALFALFAKTIP
jgi:hypothetical protein